MSMLLTQARLPKKLILEMETIVKKGHYENKSDFIRDAVRRLVFEEQAHSINISGSSVKEVRKTRQKLSDEKIDLNEINSLE